MQILHFPKRFFTKTLAYIKKKLYLCSQKLQWRLAHGTGRAKYVRTPIGNLRTLAALHDNTVARLQKVRCSVEQKRSRSLQTQRVRQIARVGEPTDMWKQS